MRPTPSTTAAASPRRRRLDRVSLVCVETRRPQLALYAMERCLRGIDFGEALLLTPHPFPAHPQIRHVAIPDIGSVAEYSQFMLRGLGEHFSLDHALVVQWDGFVTDPARWDDAFLACDYIGAPWARRAAAVGNGGFSLRSRRLVDALRAMDTPVTHPEDACICERYRLALEREHGIRFAAAELARRFSWEEIVPAELAFGFHAFFNFYRVLSERELLGYFALCDDALLRTVPARRLLKNLYRAGMREAAAALLRRRLRGTLAMRADALKIRTIAALGGYRR